MLFLTTHAIMAYLYRWHIDCDITCENVKNVKQNKKGGRYVTSYHKKEFQTAYTVGFLQ